MNQVLVRGIQGERFYTTCGDVQDLIKKYSEQTGVPESFIRASCRSKPVKNIENWNTIELAIRVLGGKGSFGSMLKGQGIAAKVDNFESCRDLSGRRIRDVNNEIRLKEWKEKQDEKKKVKDEVEQEVMVPIKRKKKVSKEFNQAVKERTKSVQNAFAEGLKKVKFE